MDEAVMARFEQWFREASRQIASLREETAGRFDQTHLEIASLREETSDRFVETSREIAASRDQTVLEIAVSRDETAVRFDQTTQEFAALREETTRRFDRNEETARHTLVLLENLRDEYRLIAEAYLGINERVERYHSQSTLTFEQVVGWIQPHFRDMDRRLGTVEGWAERQQGDVLDAVRRLLERLSLQKAAQSPSS